MQTFDLTGHKLPKLTDKFRPRADASILSMIVQNAWNAYAEEVRQPLADSALREAITVQLESLYPAADMDVLARYGFTDSRDKVTVRIWRPEGGPIGGGWHKAAFVELTRPVRVSSRGGDLTTPAPWYLEPDLGLTEEGKASLEKYGSSWEKHAAEIAAHLRRCVAAEYVEAFNRYAEAQEAYAAEYRTVTDWPAQVKNESGDYPTWEALADAFPVTGRYLRARIAA